MAYYIDEVILELGLIDVDSSVEETRRQNTINKRCPPDTIEEKAWSRTIRQEAVPDAWPNG
jgi:hypothetical protein